MYPGGLRGLGLAGVLVLAVGCAESKATTPAPPPPTVIVAPVVRQDVPLFIEAVSVLDGYVDADIRARVRGVLQAQRYKDGAMADAKVFRLEDGLTWRLGEKTRTETNLRDWLGERAQAGRLPPNGFPKAPRF